jgi:23S rRNA maturation-related 3'-5' exoribonuclease YhaM
MATKKKETKPPVELDNRKYVVDRLLATKREGMEDLVKYMDEIGFFHAPCSGGNHLCCEFGLVQHTRNVMMCAENIGYALLGKEKYEEIRDSVTIAAALHDLGKCGDHGKALYVPNILKSGEQSKAKPYERNKELCNIPHSVRSIKLATLFIDLTDDEEWAIYAHDGLYDHAKYIIPGHETPLFMILHWADMWSSHYIETKKSNESEDK